MNWSAVAKPSLQSFLSVTPTAIKILCKHTHVYTSIASFVKAGRIAKHYKAAVWISTNSFNLNFFTLQSLLLKPTPIHFQFPPSQNSKQRISYVTFCMVRCPHCKPRIHNKRRNIDSQRTISLQQLQMAATCTSYTVANIRLFMGEV
jgi:hypothetical protein